MQDHAEPDKKSFDALADWTLRAGDAQKAYENSPWGKSIEKLNRAMDRTRAKRSGASMTDAEIRGKLLEHFHNLRRSNGGWVPTTEEILAGPDYIGPQARRIIASVCRQLADARLIEWEPFTGANEGHIIGKAIITAHGVDVVEGRRESSIDIRFSGMEERRVAPSYLVPARSPLAPAPAASDVVSGSTPSGLSAPFLEIAAPASPSGEVKNNELLILKPTFFGMSIDLKEAWRRLWIWWKGRK